MVRFAIERFTAFKKYTRTNL